MRDPYALYARRVLKLEPIDKIDQLADAADKGTIIHDALDTFTTTFPGDLPDDALDQLKAIGHGLLDTVEAARGRRHAHRGRHHDS